MILTNPCTSTTIGALTLSSSTLTVTDGDSTFIEWDQPTVAADTTLGGTNLCGLLEYGVYSDTSDSSLSAAWATVASQSNGRIRLTIDTSVDTSLINDETSVN